MVSDEKEQGALSIPAAGRFSRGAARETLARHVFPAEVRDPHHAMWLAADAAVNKNRPHVFIMTHFGYGDPISIIGNVLFEIDGVKDRTVVLPQSIHQAKKPYKLAGKLLHCPVLPVLNNHARTREPYVHMSDTELNELKDRLNAEYLAAGVKAMSKGGSLLVAVNSGRSDHVDFSDDQRPLGMMFAGLTREGVSDFGIVEVSIGLEGVTDYSQFSKYNFFKKYLIHLGEYMDSKQFLQRAEQRARETQQTSRKRNSPYKQIDQLVREDLDALAPVGYGVKPEVR